jgi:peptide deformylase
MAEYPVLKLGHPILRKKAQPVAMPVPENIHNLLVIMEEAMKAAGGVGLAAPQIGVSLQVLMYKLPHIDGADGKIYTLINPEITPLSDEQITAAEGCLSVPGLRADVPRHAHIRYRAVQADGAMIEAEASGFHARVIQHEMDHLLGMVYLDRVLNSQTIQFVDAQTTEIDASLQEMAKSLL